MTEPWKSLNSDQKPEPEPDIGYIRKVNVFFALMSISRNEDILNIRRIIESVNIYLSDTKCSIELYFDKENSEPSLGKAQEDISNFILFIDLYIGLVKKKHCPSTNQEASLSLFETNLMLVKGYNLAKSSPDIVIFQYAPRRNIGQSETEIRYKDIFHKYFSSKKELGNQLHEYLIRYVLRKKLGFAELDKSIHPSGLSPSRMVTEKSQESEYVTKKKLDNNSIYIEEEFDVFLCHNNVDKPSVKRIAKLLEKRGIRSWIDEEQICPGDDWLETLENQLKNINSAAVFIGNGGVGPWQNLEIKSILREFVKRKCPVIPVLLPDAPDKVNLPLFLEGFMRVDFRKNDPDPLEQLIRGIRRR